MPSKADLQRMFSGGRAPAVPRPAQPAQSTQGVRSLRPPPDGYAYIPDAVHGVRLVQVAPPSQPHRAAGTSGSSPASAAMPSGLIIPGRRASCQLVRPGVDSTGAQTDRYQQLLDSLPDVQPGQVPDVLYRDLVPDPSMVDRIPRAHGVRADFTASEDPAQDAWGTRPALVSVGLPDTGGD